MLAQAHDNKILVERYIAIVRVPRGICYSRRMGMDADKTTCDGYELVLVV